MDVVPVLVSILTLFLMIGAGFLARKRGHLKEPVVHTISHILVNIALPALTISSMQVAHSEHSFDLVSTTLFIACAYYLGAFIISILVCRFLFATPTEKGVFQFMLVFPNVGFMGIPISEAILGPDALIYVILFNLPFNLLVFTMGIWLLAHERRGSLDPLLLLTPGFVASLVGLAFFLTGYDIPFPVDAALHWIGMATTPLAMIVVGALLATLPFSRLAGDWRILVITALRLILFPVLAYLLLAPILSDRLLLASTVLLIAMPVAANTVLLSEEYDVDATLASQGVFLSTLLSCATIPLIDFILF